MSGHGGGEGGVGGQGPPSKRSRGPPDFPEDHGNPGLGEFLERKDEKLPPNHILLITVLNAKFPINVEVIYKVCTIVGPVRRIVCFERNTVIQVSNSRTNSLWWETQVSIPRLASSLE